MQFFPHQPGMVARARLPLFRKATPQQLAKAARILMATTSAMFAARLWGWLPGIGTFLGDGPSDQVSTFLLPGASAAPVATDSRSDTLRYLILRGTGLELVNPIPDQLAIPGQSFFFPLNGTDIFSGPNGVQMLTADQPDGTELPSWIQLGYQLAGEVDARGILAFVPGPTLHKDGFVYYVIIPDGTLMPLNLDNLAIADVRDPANPQLVATASLPVSLNSSPDFVLEGDIMLAVGDSFNGQIATVDLTNATAPEVIDTFDMMAPITRVVATPELTMVGIQGAGVNTLKLYFGGLANTTALIDVDMGGVRVDDITKHTDFLYVLGSISDPFRRPILVVVDISNSNSPAVGDPISLDSGGQILMANDHLIIVGFPIRIYDISDPQSPTLIREFPILFPVLSSRYANGHLILTTFLNVQVLDIRDLSQIKIVSVAESDVFPRGSDIAGQYLYVKAGENYRLQVYDLSSGSLFGEAPTGQVGTQGVRVMARDKNGTEAATELTVISDSAPELTGIPPSITMELGSSLDYPFNRRVFFADADVSNVDVGDNVLISATEVGQTQLPSWLKLDLRMRIAHQVSLDRLSSQTGVKAVGRFLIAPSQVVAGPQTIEQLTIFETTEFAPALVNTLTLTQIWDFQVDDQYLYVLDATELKIYDSATLTDATPSVVGSLPISGQSKLSVSGQAAIIYSTDSLLVGTYHYIDLSTISSPAIIHTVSELPDITELLLDGSRIYMTSPSELRIDDVSIPTQPITLGILSGLEVNMNTMTVSDGFLYGGSGIEWLNIIDVRAPENPAQFQIIGQIDVTGSIQSIHVKGSYLFFSNGFSGVRLFDITNRSTPTEVTTLLTRNLYFGMSIRGNRIYVQEEGTLPNSGLITTIDINQWRFSGTPTTLSEARTYVIEVVAEDDAGVQAKTSFDIRVEAAPRFETAIPDQLAQVGATFSFFFDQATTFIDPNNDILKYEAQVVATGNRRRALPNWIKFNQNSGLLTGVPNPEDAGELTIEIIASDGARQSDPAQFRIFVDHFPIVRRPINNIPVNLNQPFTFQIPDDTFADPDGDNIVITVSDRPSWLAYDPESRTLSSSRNPTAADISDGNRVQIRITATDSLDGRTDLFVTLVLGQFPVATQQIPDQIAGVGRPFELQLPIALFSSPDKLPLVLTARLAGSDNLLGWLRFDSNARTLIGTAPPSDRGRQLSLVFEATDSIGGIGTTTTTLVVDQFPRVESPIDDQLVRIGQPFSFIVPRQTFNTDDTLTFSATDLPIWAEFNPETREVLGNPEVQHLSDQGGRPTITITATTELGAATSTSVTLILDEFPTVGTPLEDQVAGINQPWIFSVPSTAFVKSDGSPLRLTVTQANGDPRPNWIDFDGQTLRGTAPPSAQNQTLALLVTATDQDGGHVSQPLTVRTNYFPEVTGTFESARIKVGQNGTIQIPTDLVTDQDVGAVLTFSATLEDGRPLPPWLQFDANNRVFFGIPGPEDARVYPIRLTANDGKGGEISLIFDLTVALNQRPFVQRLIDSQRVTVEKRSLFSFGEDTFGDPDDAMLNYTASIADGSLPSWIIFDSDKRTFTVNAPPEAIDSDRFTWAQGPQVETIKVQATDGQGTTETRFEMEINGASTFDQVFNSLIIVIGTPSLGYLTFALGRFLHRKFGSPIYRTKPVIHHYKVKDKDKKGLNKALKGRVTTVQAKVREVRSQLYQGSPIPDKAERSRLDSLTLRGTWINPDFNRIPDGQALPKGIIYNQSRHRITIKPSSVQKRYRNHEIKVQVFARTGPFSFKREEFIVFIHSQQLREQEEQGEQEGQEMQVIAAPRPSSEELSAVAEEPAAPPSHAESTDHACTPTSSGDESGGGAGESSDNNTGLHEDTPSSTASSGQGTGDRSGSSSASSSAMETAHSGRPSIDSEVTPLRDGVDGDEDSG